VAGFDLSVRRACEHTFVPSKPRFTEEQVRDAIARSESYTAALRRLGMRPAGGNHKTLRRYVEQVWRIPTDHLDPAAARLRALARHRRAPAPLAEVLVRDSTYSRGTLKQRLFEEGLKAPRCELCGQGEEWRGRRMALILDHINGVATDNRLENLRIVCPNCAATLDTHCGRNLNRWRFCAVCGARFLPSRRDQQQCSTTCGGLSERSRTASKARRIVERPPYEELLAEIAASSHMAVGRKYGVSDNAIRKWVRQYERERQRESPRT
jgi:predicted nucleic acid-binding Zn ribbon protein